MKNTTHDPAKPIGKVTLVKDFLPPPSQLVPQKNTVSVTVERTDDSWTENGIRIQDNFS
jgi:hypothetical protein